MDNYKIVKRKGQDLICYLQLLLLILLHDHITLHSFDNRVIHYHEIHKLHMISLLETHLKIMQGYYDSLFKFDL